MPDLSVEGDPVTLIIVAPLDWKCLGLLQPAVPEWPVVTSVTKAVELLETGLCSHDAQS